MLKSAASMCGDRTYPSDMRVLTVRHDLNRDRSPLLSGSEPCYCELADDAHASYISYLQPEFEHRKLVPCQRSHSPRLKMLLLAMFHPITPMHVLANASGKLMRSGVVATQVAGLRLLKQRAGTARLFGVAGDQPSPVSTSPSGAITPPTIVVRGRDGLCQNVRGQVARLRLEVRPASKWILKAEEGAGKIGLRVLQLSAASNAVPPSQLLCNLVRQQIDSDEAAGVFESYALQPLVESPFLLHERKLNQRHFLCVMARAGNDAPLRLFVEKRGLWMIGQQPLTSTSDRASEVVNNIDMHGRGRPAPTIGTPDGLLDDATPEHNGKGIFASYVHSHPTSLSPQGWDRWGLIPPSRPANIQAAYDTELMHTAGLLLKRVRQMVPEQASGQFGLMAADYLLDRHGKLWIIEVNIFPVMPPGESGSPRYRMYHDKWAAVLGMAEAAQAGVALPAQSIFHEAAAKQYPLAHIEWK